MTTNVSAITTKGLTAKLKTALQAMGKSNPTKGYTSNEILTEVIRHNPGLSTELIAAYKIDVSKRLALLAQNNKIRREVSPQSRAKMLYYPATLDVRTAPRTRKAKPVDLTVVKVTAPAVVKTEQQTTTAMQQIRQLLNQLTPMQLSEVVSISGSMLAAQAESNAEQLREKLNKLMQTL